jgi:hypothetical protein
MHKTFAILACGWLLWYTPKLLGPDWKIHQIVFETKRECHEGKEAIIGDQSGPGWPKTAYNLTCLPVGVHPKDLTPPIVPQAR